jgi:hypothetical protein
MSKESDGLKFDSVESDGFMGTSATKVDIGGRSLIISGRNEVGKSRFINLLLSGLDSKNQPTEIISKGAEKGYSKVVIAGELNGRQEEYSVEMFFTPKNQSGRIVLTDKDGNKVNSPKEVLKGIVGNISFDINKFLSDTKANKIKILKELSGVRVDIDKIEMSRKKIFDDRTFLNRKVEEDEAVMNNHGLTPDEIDTFSEPIDIAPVQAELDTISAKITQWNDIKIKTENFRVSVVEYTKKKSDNLENIEYLLKQIQDLKDANDKLDTSISEATEKHMAGLTWLNKTPEPNAQEISARLSNASLHNQNHEKVKALSERQKALLKDKQAIQKYTSDIEKLDADKDKLIANSKLPVKGLSFSDSDIFYKGLPLEHKQINSATILDIGVEISMALNPNLKAIFIHEGSLFDKKSLAALIKKVEARGYQVICECVSDSDELDITFIESQEG